MPLQIRSLVHEEGGLELSLVDLAIPTPEPDEVVVRIDAAPLNPSDIGVLLARADLGTLRSSGTPQRPVTSANASTAGMGARLGKAIPVGNEGAGVVIDAGASAAAQALLGKTVGVVGGGMYATHRVLAAAACLVLPEGTSAEDGASNYVNPMTALAMLETLRGEGHRALVHTAAASNLGQMLVKLCAKDGVPLVNVVRRPEQIAMLRALGAEHVCDSSSDSFEAELTRALVATGATLVFDATGGGTLGSRILQCAEAALLQSAPSFSPYGSTTHKQLYLYGGLDRSPTQLTRAYGMAWGVGGWLVGNALSKLGSDVAALRTRVASELKTTFASRYTKRISLAEALEPSVIAAYAKQATGEKYLIVPSE